MRVVVPTRSIGRGSEKAPGARPMGVVVAAVAIILVAIAGLALAVAANARDNLDDSAVVQGTLTREPPPGSSAEFAWAVDIRGGARDVAVADNRVAYLDNSGVLRLVNADSGARIFTSEPMNVSDTAKPFLATAQGVAVCGVIDGTTILLWRTDAETGAAPRQIVVDASARLFRQGGGLLVSTGTEHSVVTADGTLRQVEVPADEVALGVTPDGQLVSAPPRGGWTMRSTDASAASERIAPRASPSGTEGEMRVAWLSRGIVLAWGTTADPHVRTVALYAVGTGEMLAANTLESYQLEDGIPLTVSPNRKFASAGPMLADLVTGHTTIVDRWSTIMSDDRGMYGLRDGARMIWRGSTPEELAGEVVIPWGTSAAGYAIVQEAARGDRIRLGGLLPSS